MNTVLTRRKFFATSALVGGGLALAACTVNTSGTVTSATLNVMKVSAYFSAGVNAVNTLLTIPAISLALGAAGVTAVGVTEAALTAALNGFLEVAGSSVTVSFDTASVKSAFESGLSDMSSLLNTFQKLLPSLTISANDKTSVSTTLSAFATVVAFAQAMIPTVALSQGMVAAVPTMPEANALSILGVH